MNNLESNFGEEKPKVPTGALDAADKTSGSNVTPKGKFTPEFIEKLRREAEEEVQKSKSATKSIGAQKMSAAMGISGKENLARGKSGENVWREGIDGKDPNKW